MDETPSPISSESTRVEDVEPEKGFQIDKDDVMNMSFDTRNGDKPVINQNQESQPASLPAWISSLKPDKRVQPWRAHEGIAEDSSFTKGTDMVFMEATEYPGGSLAA